MGYPNDYPDYFKESIFMATLDGGGDPGDVSVLFTRGGGELNAYWLTYVGRHPDGDLMHLRLKGTAPGKHYNPDEAEAVLGDISWGAASERPRLSQPVRRWLDSRDYVIADTGKSLEALAHQHNIDLGL